MKSVRSRAAIPWRECRHCVDGYRFLRKQDLLVVSGGGQLDDDWGGAWGHPFALFKWSVLSCLARVPFAFASVGVGKMGSRFSRLFLSVALRMADYRSYRDKHSRELAARLLEDASNDRVVPDLALSLPILDVPQFEGSGEHPGRASVIAISPIAFGRPESWPHREGDFYNRYLEQMAEVVAQLLDRGCSLVFVSSSLGDDTNVIPELLSRLGDEGAADRSGRLRIARIASWKDFVLSLRGVDFLIASRLHSTILSFITQTPAIAISFDPKVDWLMEDFGQTDLLLQIREFAADDVISALERLATRRNAVVGQIRTYLDSTRVIFGEQYDTLADLADSGRRRLV